MEKELDLSGLYLIRQKKQEQVWHNRMKKVREIFIDFIFLVFFIMGILFISGIDSIMGVIL